jgi:hypothetical protein
VNWPAARASHALRGEVREDGTTRFRLWAPGARQVELWLEEPRRAVAMPRDAGGWAEHVTREAPAGTRYRYRIDGELLVPDPAARFQPGDVHGASEVIDPLAYPWADGGWTGLPPERLVFYELHVGAFTAAGTYAAVAERLDHLVSLGVTAVELMPLADFPGRWGWGYDGVLLFAPEASYGRPEALKALVDAAHARGLGVFLDVVYNHFGPEGNYLHRYAPDFFNPRHQTPWATDLRQARISGGTSVHHSQRALLDRVSPRRPAPRRGQRDRGRVAPSPAGGAARAVATGPPRRRVHLVLENGANEARYLRPVDGRALWAQWNDDVHHALRAPDRRARRLLRRLPAASAASRAMPHRGLRVPGRAVRVPGGRARRALRGSATHRLRGLPPESRPDRQSRAR